jgi:hypothetical protein
MVASALSVCELYHLLEPTVLEQFRLLPKEQYTRKIGLMQRDNKEFSDALLNGQRAIRKKFIEVNGLSEQNILSLHSDAVRFFTKKKIINVIDGVTFRHDKTWSSYIRYDKIEMMYDDESITFKQVEPAILNRHTLSICRYLLNVFYKVNNYERSIISDLAKFQTQYLQRKLRDEYYLSFGRINGKHLVDNLQLFAFITNIVVKEVRRW